MLYPNRVQHYSRSFVFLNLGEEKTPAILLVCDRFRKAAERVEPIFQLTSFATPRENAGALEVVASAPGGRRGKLTVQTLLPKTSKRRILTGKDAFTVGGQCFAESVPSAPETKGCRTEISGKGDVFLNLIQIQDGDATPLPTACQERQGRSGVEIADWFVDLGDALASSARPVQWQIRNASTQTLLLDLAPGVWELQCGGKTVGQARVSASSGCFFAVLNPGTYTLAPVLNSTAPELKTPPLPARKTPPPIPGQVLADGKILPEVRTVPTGQKGKLLLPLAKLLPTGLSNQGKTLNFRSRGYPVRLQAGDREVRIGKLLLPLDRPLRAGEFLLPAPLAAGLLGMSQETDASTGTALLSTIEDPGNILLVDAGDDSHRLWRLLNGKAEEWAVYGRRIPVEIVLIEPVELDQIAIRWARGTSRKTSFLLQLSADGKQFHTVFDGASSGHSLDYEPVKFPKQKVQALRFVFRGSQVGPWNQLSDLKIGAASSGKRSNGSMPLKRQ